LSRVFCYKLIRFSCINVANLKMHMNGVCIFESHIVRTLLALSIRCVFMLEKWLNIARTNQIVPCIAIFHFLRIRPGTGGKRGLVFILKFVMKLMAK